MTDDDFVFGDDTDESEEVNESELLGARPFEPHSEAGETERRFGASTTDDTESLGFTKRVQSVTGDGIVRMAVATILTVAVVAALGLVAYPFAMGALDGAGDRSGEADITTLSGDIGDPTVSRSSQPPTGTRAEQSRGVTATPTSGTETEATSETAEATTRTNRTPTASPTEGTTTPPPTRGFPAGDPA